MTVKTFDMNKLVCTVGGLPITGWADGDALMVEYDEDSWTEYIGCDGEVTRVYQSRKHGTITIRLGPLSASNRTLAQLKRTDDETGVATVPIFIFDMLGGDQFLAPQAWCKKDPGRTFGRDVTEKEWIYFAPRIEAVHGGGVPL